MRTVKYHEMSDEQKADLLEALEDMLEQLNLAECELGAGMTYGHCVFPFNHRNTTEEQTS